MVKRLAAPRKWAYLAHVTADHPGWEEEKFLTEERIQRVLARTGDDPDRVLFATWTRWRAGEVTYYYETCSPRVHEGYFAELWHELPPT